MEDGWVWVTPFLRVRRSPSSFLKPLSSVDRNKEGRKEEVWSEMCDQRDSDYSRCSRGRSIAVQPFELPFFFLSFVWTTTRGQKEKTLLNVGGE